MADWFVLDTRQTQIAHMMDGFLHILPGDTYYKHEIGIRCWCDPRVVWSDEAGTCIVSHRRRNRHKETICA